MKNSILYCSFCLKNQIEVTKLIIRPNVHICSECIIFCDQLIIKQRQKKKQVQRLKIITPKKMMFFLDQHVIGQNNAKKIISVAIYNHYKRIKWQLNNNINCDIQKSNILLIGKTGTGKTLIAKTIARKLKVPFVIVDATSLTEAGYIGDDIESIINNLLVSAENHKHKAERGIVYVDEIDKIAKKVESSFKVRDVSGEGVQQSLLKLFEGNIININQSNKKKTVKKQKVNINTKNILFMCGGAFVGLEEIIKKRLGEKNIGFKYKKKYIEGKNILHHVEVNDLIAYGLIPEFIGRLPIIASLNNLNQEDLLNILTKPQNALIKQYQKLFYLEGLKIIFDRKALLRIADLAFKQKSGARGLRMILESSMLEVMFYVPYIKNIKLCIITKEVISKNREPLLIFK